MNVPVLFSKKEVDLNTSPETSVSGGKICAELESARFVPVHAESSVGDTPVLLGFLRNTARKPFLHRSSIPRSIQSICGEM